MSMSTICKTTHRGINVGPWGRWGATIFVGALGLFLSASAVRAESAFLVADNHPDLESFFTLDFGEMGGVTSAFITNTRFVLDVDAKEGTARFVEYHQDIEPLILPGGISTGDITIEIVEGSSSGTFDPKTNEYMTTELYAIFFTEDLSMFGVESPLILESTSNGILDMDSNVTGTIAMEWEGGSDLQNPGDPKNPIEFTYTCTVNSQFAQAGTGDFNADDHVDFEDYLELRVCFVEHLDSPVGSACAAGDFDVDGDIDFDDVAAFRSVYGS